MLVVSTRMRAHRQVRMKNTALNLFRAVFYCMVNETGVVLLKALCPAYQQSCQALPETMSYTGLYGSHRVSHSSSAIYEATCLLLWRSSSETAQDESFNSSANLLPTMKMAEVLFFDGGFA